MVVDMRRRMSLFVVGLTRLSSKEGKAVMLIGYMGITRLMIHMQQKGPAPSSASALAPKNKRSHSGMCRDDSTSCFKSGQNSHFMRECPKSRQSNGNGGIIAQSSSVAPLDRAVSK
ncbi:hypothetical protein MTR67_006782 [Solanum verrucosum]|uniref:Gag-pol polyprotein n=1 Tax=Solanum verrucosum TaxID=315347 RepID=A0AAF0PYW7_SOLVR|nr:hypothetical protein MTR67_006782 [Solanum verrucosum]